MSQLPTRPPVAQMVEMIRTQADIPGLLRTLAECYQLTVSAERDIVGIEAKYALEQADSERRHEAVMKAMDHGFRDRASFMAQMDATAKQLIALGHIDQAQALLMRMMDVQSNSIIAEAMGNGRLQRP